MPALNTPPPLAWAARLPAAGFALPITLPERTSSVPAFSMPPDWNAERLPVTAVPASVRVAAAALSIPAPSLAALPRTAQRSRVGVPSLSIAPPRTLSSPVTGRPHGTAVAAGWTSTALPPSADVGERAVLPAPAPAIVIALASTTLPGKSPAQSRSVPPGGVASNSACGWPVAGWHGCFLAAAGRVTGAKPSTVTAASRAPRVGPGERPRSDIGEPPSGAMPSRQRAAHGDGPAAFRPQGRHA